MRPNVLLIVLDTARADAFEPWGAGIGATPTVRQMASAGAAAPMAIAPASWTMPSHAAMLSGVLSRTSGLGQAPGSKMQACRPVLEGLSGRLLPSVLNRAGYRTLGVSSNLWISTISGFDTGFDEFVDVRTHRVQAVETDSVKSSIKWALEALRARLDDGAAETEAILKRWLDGPSVGPFFAFVNLIECHSPYLPPSPYDGLGYRGRLKAASEARRHQSFEAIWRACLGQYQVPSDALARMRHLYGQSVRLMDDWLARIFEMLDSSGLLDDTLVILTSDHGENLGEGQLMGHSFSLDQRLIHVPLVSMGPGAFRPTPITSLADLPRMVAGAIELADHPWQEDHGRDGVAVSQLDRLTTLDDPRVALAVERWNLDERGARRMAESITCATDGRYKLVRNASGDWFFDLEADPLELSPVAVASAAADPVRLEKLQRAVVRAAVEPGPVAASEEIEISDEEQADLERRMRFLGYM